MRDLIHVLMGGCGAMVGVSLAYGATNVAVMLVLAAAGLWLINDV